MDNLTNVKETWQKVLKNLEADLGPDAIALWMSQIRPLVIESETVRLEVPTQVIYINHDERYRGRGEYIDGEVIEVIDSSPVVAQRHAS